MDWTKTSVELAKPLSSAAVKERTQAGRKLSYVEGWHAIAEANRIFGFDGWQRETVEIKCVAEHARKIGKDNPRDGWGVSYIAKARVTVGDVTREGWGAGHGIDTDLGLAHESAIKECETDALKRALMTFGNPFGLALYDKTQANVSDEPPEKSNAEVYTEASLAILKSGLYKDRANAVGWFNSEKENRRKHGLSQGHVDLLLAALNETYPAPKEKVA